ncbi:KEOPS complex subunit Cgi121 [Haloplanus halophilus]|uniref:KEOPS complex subunit Cgi121 n=1 Tax=Haloplanus halophilus TaxID=2949993 RepID=UPI002040AC69|nr:KEOPS complex subunit Cgi121 [Haloplanus sp. GDY1]
MIVVEGVATVSDLDDFLATLDAAAEEYGVTVQAFDARYLVGRTHLERAVELADRAFERGENVARERSVEILLYAAGRRQIDDALEMGVSEGETPVAVLIDGAAGDESAAADALRDRLDLDPAPTLGSVDAERVRAFFDVTSAELDAGAGDLSDLVCERVALLDVEK